MRKVFDEELQDLHNILLRMGSVVEQQIYLCIESLVNQDIEQAEEIIKNDDIVDDLQKQIEDRSIKLIAMQQPLATDLRNIFTATKIAADLERMADHAVDIAKITKRLRKEVYIKELVKIPVLADLVKEMIKESLDAYVQGNVDKAYKASKIDNEIDKICKSIFEEMLLLMADDPSSVTQATQFLFVYKFLERTAAHATNICECTIYLVTGEQVDLND